MGLFDRFALRELKARIKRRRGERTGDRALAAAGRTEEAEARLLRTADRIRAVAREIRREYGVRG